MRGATILACEKIETVPSDLDYSVRLEDDRLVVWCTLLDPKESITLRILLVGRIDTACPQVTLRVPARKRIVVANNIRWSRESFILGIIFLCCSTYLLASTEFQEPTIFWALFLGGVLFLGASWMDRKSRPRKHDLPSHQLWEMIKTLPVVLPIGLALAAIYYWFGRQACAIAFVSLLCMAISGTFWSLLFEWATRFLKRQKRGYNAFVVGVLTSLPSLAFLAFCIWILLELYLTQR